MASVVGLTRIWAAGPQTPNLDPGLTKWALGWIAEIPTLQVLNFINNRSDTNQLALAERGVFEWVSGIAYKLGALTWDEADSVIYKCKVSPPDNNLRPGLNLTQWEPSSIQISRFAYDANAAAWAAHIANTANPHQLTAHQLSSYTAVEIDQKVGVVASAINAHVAIVAGNPHHTTSADVGAVPIAGGAYTGVVNHRAATTTIGPTALGGSLFVNTNGVFIARGATAKLGLSATSRPVAIDEAGVASVLLTEASYVAQRTAQSPLYATPAPDSWLVAKNGLQLATGQLPATYQGPAGRPYNGKDGQIYTSVANTPMLTPYGMRLDSLSDNITVPMLNNLQGFAQWTWHLDMRTSNQATASNNYVIAKCTSGHNYFMQQGNLFSFTFYVAGVFNFANFGTITANSDHKATVTYNGTVLSLYLDGVLVNTVTANVEKFVADAGGIQAGYNGQAGNVWHLREMKTWNTALTAKQISQL